MHVLSMYISSCPHLMGRKFSFVVDESTISQPRTETLFGPSNEPAAAIEKITLLVRFFLFVLLESRKIGIPVRFVV